jgi:hypothetical protein
MVRFYNLIIFLSFFILIGGYAYGRDFERNILTHEKAICTNGEQAQYYHSYAEFDADEAKNPKIVKNNWLIYLQPHAPCRDFDQCVQRFKNAIINNDTNMNYFDDLSYDGLFDAYDMRHWHMAILPNCSFDFFAGAHEVNVGNKSYPLYGRLILQSLLQHLRSNIAPEYQLSRESALIMAASKDSNLGLSFNIEWLQKQNIKDLYYIFDGAWANQSDIINFHDRKEHFFEQIAPLVIDFPTLCRQDIGYCLPSFQAVKRWRAHSFIIAHQESDFLRISPYDANYQRVLEQEIKDNGYGLSLFHVQQSHSLPFRHFIERIQGHQTRPLDILENFLEYDSQNSVLITNQF